MDDSRPFVSVRGALEHFVQGVHHTLSVLKTIGRSRRFLRLAARETHYAANL
jgi:hypothetical protein